MHWHRFNSLKCQAAHPHRLHSNSFSQRPESTGNVWFHLLGPRSKQAVSLQGPCCSFWHMSHTTPMLFKPIVCYSPVLHPLCVCVCVCCGRAIMACLTQSTSITCCNLEHHHQVNMKGTASKSPPCTPFMCICLHVATPLLSCACIAQHRHHYCKISCISQANQLCFHCFPSETICSCHA